MSVTVVTTFGPDGYRLYGRRFLDRFAKYWERDLLCYVEEYTPLPCGEMLDFWTVPGVEGFLQRHGTDPKAAGNVRQPIWRDKEVIAGHSFRTDALKFFRKPLVVADAADRIGVGTLVWLDADVMTMRPVPQSLVDRTLEDADVAYLGRDGTHSECGFLAFRLPEARAIIDWWAACYASDRVFALPEWHDSYVFDRAREVCSRVRCRNISPGGYGNVWVRSPLAPYMDHLKGEELKRIGCSAQWAGAAS